MLDVERHGNLATLRMDHGPVNALDLELVDAITRTIARLDADPDVDAMVLAGNTRAFCAGVDLSRIIAADSDYTERFLVALSGVFLAPLRSATPIVAAVNGHAIAGGAVLAAACDHVIGTDDERARLGLVELAVGVPFPTAAIEIMRHRLGSALQQAIVTAGTHSGREAMRLGFLDQLVPAGQLIDEARAVAATLGAVPRKTMALTKRQLWRPVEEVLVAHGEKVDRAMREAWMTAAVQASMEAFMRRTVGKGNG